MSGLARRLVIFATIEGLVLQSQGHSEHHKSLLIDYRSQSVIAKSTHQYDHNSVRLEAHGLIGFINVATSSYLIAITKREEVARIFDKPVYLVTDIALLPLSSQREAAEAIKDATGFSETASDDSDSSAGDTENANSDQAKAAEVADTPVDETGGYQGKNASSTSVAEDVATRNVSFGTFASQWLSRPKLPASRPSGAPPDVESSEPKPASKDDDLLKDLAIADNDKRTDTQSDPGSPGTFRGSKYSTTMKLLPRILGTTKMILTSGSYFFSYDIDLTKRFEDLTQPIQPLDHKNLDPLFFWNRHLGAKLLESNNSNCLTPILQGFVGQRAFTLSKSSSSTSKTEVTAVTADVNELQQPSDEDKTGQAFLLTLISRKSTKRAGLRYLRRGIDDEGNVANFAETEQILSAADWSKSVSTRSFVQVRGSIPAYFSQSPYQLKPTVVLHNSPQANQKAFEKHVQSLKQRYGSIQAANLVNQHGTEQRIGEAYEKMYETLKDGQTADVVFYEWFDFHSECRGMKFENVSRLVDRLDEFLQSSGETILRGGAVESRQTGVIRTNCMDCLDRTNVAQSAFAQHKLQASLEDEGYSIDFVKDPSTNWFNTLWADNGDAISRQYASTAALKGDYTRTRKRNWRGAMNDFGLTISRYYSNMVNDFFSQAVIDMLLGNVSWKVFEDFESKMMSTDPGISVQSGREAAIEKCSKIVIQEPDKEDLVHAWTMLVPDQENTLRTMPFEEAVVLLTDVALYCCKMDWSMEKIARFEKVDLRNVKKIRWGVYVNSTFTERQMTEDINQGLVVYYTPGKGDVVRVNTRSLHNYHIPEEGGRSGVDGGTGILSWVAASVTRQPQDRMMALKVVPPGDDDELASSKGGRPNQVAEGIADEIRRAIVGSTTFGEQRGGELVEHGDVIGVDEAKRRTGYLEQVSHSLKRLVWA